MCSNEGMSGSAGRPRSGVAAAAVVTVILAGCGSPRPADDPQAEPPPAPPAIEIRLVDHQSLIDEIARHRGRVVVLDCWSTSCPPCVAEFPGLVRLAARHGETVRCLSLCFDYDGIGAAEELIPPVRSFLEKVGATEVVNMFSIEEADRLSAALDLTSVPAVFVYRPDGSLAVRFDDEMAAGEFGRPFTYDDVEAAVGKLLAESGSPAAAEGGD
jgi:thiol-disulfide isomerase/thioredoxin